MATKLYWTDPDSEQVITVIFDAVTGLSPEDLVTITDHPVEQGFPVTDGARSQPARLSIEGIVALTPNPKIDTDAGLAPLDLKVIGRKRQNTTLTLDVPKPPIQLSESGLLQAGVGAITGLFSGAPKISVSEISGTLTRETVTAQAIQQDTPRNRIRDMYDTLLLVKDQHALITILSKHRDYFDMMIERLAKPQVAADGTSAKFQIDLKQIRTVTSQSVTAPKPAEPRGNGMANRGSQGGKPSANPGKKTSVLKQLKQMVLIKTARDVTPADLQRWQAGL
ncbi:MAG: phage baseplate protein [Pseudomonadota bacterium]